jgi:hypothetical protein
LLPWRVITEWRSRQNMRYILLLSMLTSIMMLALYVTLPKQCDHSLITVSG